MSERTGASINKTFKPGRIAVAVVYLIFLAVVARTLSAEETRPFINSYLRLELVFIILFTLVLWKPRLPVWTLHLYLVVQSLLTLWMLSLQPEFDFIILLYAMLTYQVSLYFSGWIRWTWVGILISLTGGPLIYYLGWLDGLASSLTTIVGEIVLTAYIIASQQISISQETSQELLSELQDSNRQLQQYANQVEELASVQERNRLARELHDRVSQLIFSISLTTRSAQLLLEKEPERTPEILRNLQVMTADALGQLRSFITQLHPPQES